MTKRIPRPERPDKIVDVDDRDDASPLGRGANPGASVAGGPIEGQGVAGARGVSVPRAKGGPEGTLQRENEDATSEARR